MRIWEATVSHICKRKRQEKSGTCKRLFAKLWGLLLDIFSFFWRGGGFYAAENSKAAQIPFTYRRETEITNLSPTPKLLSQTLTVQTKHKVFLHKRETCIFISLVNIYFPVGQCSYFWDKERIFGTEFFRGRHCSSGTLSDRSRTAQGPQTDHWKSAHPHRNDSFRYLIACVCHCRVWYVIAKCEQC